MHAYAHQLKKKKANRLLLLYRRIQQYTGMICKIKKIKERKKINNVSPSPMGPAGCAGSAGGAAAVQGSTRRQRQRRVPREAVGARRSRWPLPPRAASAFRGGRTFPPFWSQRHSLSGEGG